MIIFGFARGVGTALLGLKFAIWHVFQVFNEIDTAGLFDTLADRLGDIIEDAVSFIQSPEDFNFIQVRNSIISNLISSCI